MTREEAWNRIDAIIARHEIDDDYVTITSILDYDALRMARKALEQEPSGDLISRQAVLDLAQKGVIVSNRNYESVCKAINELPSVNPQEPKTGHWIWNYDKGYCKCSECGIGMGHTEFDYCPNCGARMVEPQESEDKE